MRIGYACKAIGVPNTTISRCLLKNADEENLRSIIGMNLDALKNLLNYNIKNRITLFRISSDIIPLASHALNKILWWEEFKDKLEEIGIIINQNDIRVSMHPGQYTVINSNNKKVVEDSVKELVYHALFLDTLGLNATHKLVLHVGGVYNNKEKAIQTFVENYRTLPDTVRRRLVLENDDKCYNIEDVLKISAITGSPVIFDNLHNKLNPSNGDHNEAYWIGCCAQTWRTSDGTQKIHFSLQNPDAIAGSHSETICLKEFERFYEGLPKSDIDIMLEVKDKNLSAMKCINTFLQKATSKTLEEEWAKYKYLVLGKSAEIYNDIRHLLKEKNSICAKNFYEYIETAMQCELNYGAEKNAAMHVWGYFKNICTSSERNKFDKYLEACDSDMSKLKSLKNFLFSCAKKYEIEYLLNSLYFYV